MSQPQELYQSRKKIQPRHITGRFQTIRNLTRWLTLSVYFIIPWLSWDGRKLILFNVAKRKFRILMFTFWPQDFFLLTLLVLVATLALLVFTTIAGRIWCGYTCPQTVWTKVFMWLERLIEGDRNKRISLDQSSLTWTKFYKRTTKHAAWLLVAFATAVTFGGYFQPIGKLIIKMVHFDLVWWEALLIAFFTFATYLNAGWMREQVCMYMCPYARVQSVMFDKDTLVISYDAKRGENRGSRKKHVDYKAQNLGDCIDCRQCVHVCPTGIDIRDGLQMECIGCAACIDACDAVMDKMNYPKGLVRYATEHSLANEKTRFLRPRLMIYSAIFVFMTLLLCYFLYSRVPLQLDIARDRTTLYRETADLKIENSYLLKILNMSQKDSNYVISIVSPKNLQYIGSHEVFIEEGKVLSLPITLSIARQDIIKLNSIVIFRVEAKDNKNIAVNTESRFIAPVRE